MGERRPCEARAQASPVDGDPLLWSAHVATRVRCVSLGRVGQAEAMITVDHLTKAYGQLPGRRRRQLRLPAGPGDRLPRSQRRRQDHDHAGHGRTHAGRPSGRVTIGGLDVRRHPQPGAPCRCPARRLRAARRSDRSRDPRARRAGDGTAVARGSTRCSTLVGLDRRRGQAAAAQLLARHEAAARHRARAARRPRGADPRRARQRPRPGRHPVDARPAEVLRRPRRHRAASPATCSTRSS